MSPYEGKGLMTLVGFMVTAVAVGAGLMNAIFQAKRRLEKKDEQDHDTRD